MKKKGMGREGRGGELEGTYNDYLVQLPDHFRADQKLKYVIKGIVQMLLEQ